MKKELIFVLVIIMVSFCLFLLYTRLEVQRLIAMRVQSALEVNRTASIYLRTIRAATMPVVEKNGGLMLEPSENVNGEQ